MALENVLRHCQLYGEDRTHTAWVGFVWCPRPHHWHHGGHYTCTECGNDASRPIYGHGTPEECAV